MNNTIHKFTLKLEEIQEVELPVGARIIAVAAQGPKLRLWAEVDSKAVGREFRTIFIVGTGCLLPRDRKIHLGTVVMPGCVTPESALVCHVYERSPLGRLG